MPLFSESMNLIWLLCMGLAVGKAPSSDSQPSIAPDPDYQFPISKGCKAHSQLGMQEHCCTGEQRPPSPDTYETCKDMPPDKRDCPSNLVWLGDRLSGPHNTNETCSKQYQCNWVKFQFNWDCCPCPVFYVPTTNAANCSYLQSSGGCLGCEGAFYGLHGNKTVGYTCKPICGSLDQKYKKDKRCGKVGSCPDTLCDQDVTTNCVSYGECKMNSAGLALLKKYEQCCPTVYTIRGDDTIGWGHDCTQNKENCKKKYGSPIYLFQAYDILGDDLTSITNQLISKFGRANMSALNTNQFSALLDYSFNAGAGSAHTKFGASVASKNYEALCNGIEKASNGDPKRRAAEATLCREATTVVSGC